LPRDAFSIIAGEQHMPNRTAKFVSAIIASFLAAAPFASKSQSATPAADNCVASPKNEAPQGSHWYYRIEHPSNRHCWYLRGEQNAASSASAANAPAPAPVKSSLPGAASTMPGSVANARAELISQQTHGDADANIVTGQVPAAASGPVADVGNPPPAQDTNMLRSVVASRWPVQLAANGPAASAPVSDSSNADAPPNAVTSQPSAAAVVPLTAADGSPAKPSSSIQMLLIAIVGALSVAGLAASAVGFGGRRKNRVHPIEGERRAIWETVLADAPLSSPFPAASRPHLGLPKELHGADDPDDRIAEMLVRLARSARA
jgi:hypothetical protein